MPHSSEFIESKLMLGDEVELEKVRKALNIDHPLIRAFQKTWKDIAGWEGKEEKFFRYLQRLEASVSEGEEGRDGAGTSSPVGREEEDLFSSV